MQSCEKKGTNIQKHKHKMPLVNKHLAKMMNYWHTIDGLILDYVSLSLMLLQFLLHIR